MVIGVFDVLVIGMQKSPFSVELVNPPGFEDMIDNDGCIALMLYFMSGGRRIDIPVDISADDKGGTVLVCEENTLKVDELLHSRLGTVAVGWWHLNLIVSWNETRDDFGRYFFTAEEIRVVLVDFGALTRIALVSS
jgi:hypothetical protein